MAFGRGDRDSVHGIHVVASAVATLDVQTVANNPHHMLIPAHALARNLELLPRTGLRVEHVHARKAVGVLEGRAAVHIHVLAVRRHGVRVAGDEAFGEATAGVRDVLAADAVGALQELGGEAALGVAAEDVHVALNGRGGVPEHGIGAGVGRLGPLHGLEVESPDVVEEAVAGAAAVDDHHGGLVHNHQLGGVVEAGLGGGRRLGGDVRPLGRLEVELPNVVEGKRGALATEDVHLVVVDHRRVGVAGGRGGGSLDVHEVPVTGGVYAVHHSLVLIHGGGGHGDVAGRADGHDGDLVPEGVALADALVVERVHTVAGREHDLVGSDAHGLLLDYFAIHIDLKANLGGGHHLEIVPIGVTRHGASAPVGGDGVAAGGGEGVGADRSGARLEGPALGEEGLALGAGGGAVAEVGRDEVGGLLGIRVPEPGLEHEGVELLGEVCLEHRGAAVGGVKGAVAEARQLLGDRVGCLAGGGHHAGLDWGERAHRAALEAGVEVEHGRGIVVRVLGHREVAVVHLQGGGTLARKHARRNAHVDERVLGVAAGQGIDVVVHGLAVVGLGEDDVLALLVHAAGSDELLGVDVDHHGGVLLVGASGGDVDLLQVREVERVGRVHNPHLVRVGLVGQGATKDVDVIAVHSGGVLEAAGGEGHVHVAGVHLAP
mmetsp:Transcript_37685/g.118929  ORF Transcript_37685/g.118929 Transcript_37685/m.118929 type:complete len:660 (-) Transcript_37685:7278-9257(-)